MILTFFSGVRDTELGFCQTMTHILVMSTAVMSPKRTI